MEVSKLKINATKNNITKKLINTEGLFLDKDKMEICLDFIKKFILCEIACKYIVESYKHHKKELKQGQYITLDMRYIPSAITLYQYEIHKHVLSQVFSSANKRGKKSCKKLRDGMHAMSEYDIDEVCDREQELHRSMDEFLSYFKL